MAVGTVNGYVVSNDNFRQHRDLADDVWFDRHLIHFKFVECQVVRFFNGESMVVYLMV